MAPRSPTPQRLCSTSSPTTMADPASPGCAHSTGMASSCASWIAGLRFSSPLTDPVCSLSTIQSPVPVLRRMSRWTTGTASCNGSARYGTATRSGRTITASCATWRPPTPLGQGGLAYLAVQVPGGAARRVATVGGINYSAAPRSNGPVAPNPFVAGPHLLGCSASADRATVLNPDKGTVSLWRLSDGLELRTH